MKDVEARYVVGDHTMTTKGEATLRERPMDADELRKRTKWVIKNWSGWLIKDIFMHTLLEEIRTNNREQLLLRVLEEFQKDHSFTIDGALWNEQVLTDVASLRDFIEKTLESTP